MSTVEAPSRSFGQSVRGVLGGRREPLRAAARSLGVPGALGTALLLVVGYAAFAHGAAASPTEPRLQVAIAAIAAAAGGCWLWSGTLRVAAPASAVAGAGLLLAFAVWSGVTLLWSVAPDPTWIEFNRVLTYVIVLGLAIALGASYARSLELVAKGFLIVALVVTAYALGQKLLPGVHVQGVFNLNQTGTIPRLQEPLGYWNALALFLVLAAPVALSCVLDSASSGRVRLGSLIALTLLLLTVGLTFSRGGVLALVLAFAVWIAFADEKLRALMWLGVALLATAPPLVLGLTSHSLTTAGVALSKREVAGGELAAVTVASVLVLFAGGRKLFELEQTVRLGPERLRVVKRSLAGSAAAAVVIALLLVTLSARGLGGTISHAWSSFISTQGTTSVYDPHRLLSTDSENRWVWWKEAAGAFSDRPIAGWGAGSFAVVHLLYRRDTISVKQPHSVPLQLLAEDGLVGALLAMGGYALLLYAGGGTVRRRATGTERLFAAALLAGGTAYAFHSLYDWDWDIPAVTLPALIFLGVLAGARRRGRATSEPRLPGAGSGTRVVALGALGLMVSLFAVSAVLPSAASSEASSAVVAAASSSSSQLAHAQASAQLASNLDPLSDAGLLAAATIAIHQRRLGEARSDLLQAVRRDPTDVQAWEQFAALEALVGNAAGLTSAADRVIALDPEGPSSRALLQRVELMTAPPTASASALPTPLR